jgi:hypothetical protein
MIEAVAASDANLLALDESGGHPGATGRCGYNLILDAREDE